MSFAIRIFEEPVGSGPSLTGGNELRGEIEIGDFKEAVVIPISYWSKLDYISHWQRAVKILLDGDESARTALITEMYDPENALYINCWPIYREGEIVYVHNRLLFTKDLPESFDLEEIGKYMDDREATDEDGNRISEWRTTAAELTRWLGDLNEQR